MIAMWVFLRAELRQRWRSWLALALLAGVLCGTVGAAAAGARRTDSAYPDLLAWSNAPDVLVYSLASSSPTFAQLPLAALARLPQTAESATLADFSVVAPGTVALLAPVGNGVPDSFWRRKILAGRLANPARSNQVDISFTLAQVSHLKVGGTLRAVLLTNRGKPQPFDFRIAGIDAAPAEFPPQSGTGTDFVWATRLSTGSTTPGSRHPSAWRCGSATEPRICLQCSARSAGWATAKSPQVTRWPPRR